MSQLKSFERPICHSTLFHNFVMSEYACSFFFVSLSLFTITISDRFPASLWEPTYPVTANSPNEGRNCLNVDFGVLVALRSRYVQTFRCKRVKLIPYQLILVLNSRYWCIFGRSAVSSCVGLESVRTGRMWTPPLNLTFFFFLNKTADRFRAVWRVLKC